MRMWHGLGLACHGVVSIAGRQSTQRGPVESVAAAVFFLRERVREWMSVGLCYAILRYELRHEHRLGVCFLVCPALL